MPDNTHTETQQLRVVRLVDNLFFVSAVSALIGFIVGVFYTEYAGKRIVLTLTVTQDIFTLSNLTVLLFILAISSFVAYVICQLSGLFDVMHKLFFVLSIIAITGLMIVLSM